MRIRENIRTCSDRRFAKENCKTALSLSLSLCVCSGWGWEGEMESKLKDSVCLPKGRGGGLLNSEGLFHKQCRLGYIESVL